MTASSPDLVAFVSGSSDMQPTAGDRLPRNRRRHRAGAHRERVRKLVREPAGGDRSFAAAIGGRQLEGGESAGVRSGAVCRRPEPGPCAGGVQPGAHSRRRRGFSERCVRHLLARCGRARPNPRPPRMIILLGVAMALAILAAPRPARPGDLADGLERALRAGQSRGRARHSRRVILQSSSAGSQRVQSATTRRFVASGIVIGAQGCVVTTDRVAQPGDSVVVVSRREPDRHRVCRARRVDPHLGSAPARPKPFTALAPSRAPAPRSPAWVSPSPTGLGARAQSRPFAGAGSAGGGRTRAGAMRRLTGAGLAAAGAALSGQCRRRAADPRRGLARSHHGRRRRRRPRGAACCRTRA